jgi:hypothetical protein
LNKQRWRGNKAFKVAAVQIQGEWRLVECAQFEVIPRLGSERSLPELGHSGLAAAEWAEFELPLFDLLC